MSYVPSLIISENCRIEKVRELSAIGQTLVRVGENVNYNTPVLSTELPNEIYIIRIPEKIGVDISQVKNGLCCEVGAEVVEGEVIFNLKTFFGFFNITLKSPVTGTVEFFNESVGHLGIRRPAEQISIPAFINGKVIEVQENKRVKIKGEGTLLQGIFGVGGETFGEILTLGFENNKVISKSDLENLENLAGKVLIGGKTFDLSALHFAVQNNVAGIFTGSIDSSVLDDFLGYKIGAAITGDEKIGLTLIVSEGFGDLAISENIMRIARKMSGKICSLNGATQVRSGAMRPELIVSNELVDGEVTEESNIASTNINTDELKIGKQIRIIREPNFGIYATILNLPVEMMKLESGAIVRVAQVRSNDDGREFLVPRSNIELV